MNFGSKYLYEPYTCKYLVVNAFVVQQTEGDWHFYLKPKNVIQNRTKLIKKQTNTATINNKKRNVKIIN